MGRSVLKESVDRLKRAVSVSLSRRRRLLLDWLERRSGRVDEVPFEELKKRAQSLVPADGRVRLHLGCGKKRIDGFINIDLRATPATDLECNIVRLPFDEGTVERIETYHVIEHLPRHDLPVALREWRRVLAPGGALVIECPDFDTACREYLAGRPDRIDNIFGLQRFPGDTHLFGYNFERLEQVLRQGGFRQISQHQPQDYHKDLEPCLRVEALK